MSSGAGGDRTLNLSIAKKTHVQSRITGKALIYVALRVKEVKWLLLAVLRGFACFL
jgi:hypothetical protein